MKKNKIVSMSIRFPEPLQRKLAHLKADKRILSIQAFTIRAVEKEVEGMEKDG